VFDSVAFTSRRPRTAWFWPVVLPLAVVFAVALIARLMHIQHKPFWFDEVLTFRRAHLGWSGLVADSFTNRHMPSYFLIVRWFDGLGDSALALRLPSVLFGAAGVMVVFDIARRIGGRTAGIAAALLMALSPQQVQYGQEARSYTLAVLLVAIALWGVVRIAQSAGARSRLGWAAYGIGTAGALDVLGDTAPWLLAAMLAFALIFRRVGAVERAGFVRELAIVHGLILGCTLPCYVLMLQFGDGRALEKFDWIPRLSWHGVWVSLASTYLMRASAVVHLDLLATRVPQLAAIVAVLAGIGLWRVRRRTDGLVVALGFAVLPVLVLAVSMFKPMLVPRYILWSAGPFFVLAGIGAAAIPRRVAPWALAVLAVLAAVNLGPFYQTETKPRWDLAAKRLAVVVGPRDTVLTADPNAPDMLSAMQPRDRAPMSPAALITPQVAVAVARWKKGGRVWAVDGRSALGDGETLADFEFRLAAFGKPEAQIPVGKEIIILAFAPYCPGSSCG
jgi:mannosyltransferase